MDEVKLQSNDANLHGIAGIIVIRCWSSGRVRVCECEAVEGIFDRSRLVIEFVWELDGGAYVYNVYNVYMCNICVCGRKLMRECKKKAKISREEKKKRKQQYANPNPNPNPNPNVGFFKTIG